MSRTKRLRLLFEQMDKNRSGTLDQDEFKEYMARENPRSMLGAAALFRAMSSTPTAGDEAATPTISFLEVRSLPVTESAASSRRSCSRHVKRHDGGRRDGDPDHLVP